MTRESNVQTFGDAKKQDGKFVLELTVYLMTALLDSYERSYEECYGPQEIICK